MLSWKWVFRAMVAVVLLAGGVWVYTQVGWIELRRLRDDVDRLEHDKKLLWDYAQRLQSSRRVAQINVVSQKADESGLMVTQLRWQELMDDGTFGEPLELQVLGRQVYCEGMVIKFLHEHIASGDHERGQNLVLFRRIFGDQQTPQSAWEFDRLQVPKTRISSESSSLAQKLWKLFWQLAEDPRLAERYGVRVAQCEAPAAPMRTGQIWEVRLDASGGLNLKKIDESTPLAGAFNP